jgi:hypothetical protein
MQVDNILFVKVIYLLIFAQDALFVLFWYFHSIYGAYRLSFCACCESEFHADQAVFNTSEVACFGWHCIATRK